MDTEIEQLLDAVGQREFARKREFERELEAGLVRTAECPSPSLVRSVTVGKQQWTPEQKSHISTCRYCRVFVASMQKIPTTPVEMEAQREASEDKKSIARNVAAPKPIWHEIVFGGGAWPKLAFVPALLLMVAFVGFRVLNQKQENADRVLVAEVPSELRSVVRSADTTATKYPVGLTPVATAVRDGRPLFRWRGVRGAQNYSIKIWAVATPKDRVVLDVPVSGTTWQPRQDKSLAPGLYRWKVNWADKSSKWLGAPFRVLKPEESVQVSELEKRYAGDDAALAELYLKYKLFADAYTPLKRIHEQTYDKRLAETLKIAARAAGQSTD